MKAPKVAVSARSRRLGLLAFLMGLIIWLYVELRYQSQYAEQEQRRAAGTPCRMRRGSGGIGGGGGGVAGGGGGGAAAGFSGGAGAPAVGSVDVGSVLHGDEEGNAFVNLRRDDSLGPIPDDFELLYSPEWSEHTAFERLPPERLAPLTHEVQRMLYRHQFPSVCKGRKYLISSGNEELAGLGSHIHIATVHMTIAWIQNRIFIWEPWAGYIYTDQEYCGDDMSRDGRGDRENAPLGAKGSPGWVDCFFRSPTNCTLEDALEPGLDIQRIGTGGIGMQWGIYPTTIPQQFHALWTKSGMPKNDDMMKYWWRGQVSAFLTRFNPKALGRLREMRLNAATFMKNYSHPQNQYNASWLENDRLSVPLPRGAVSIHIRHGDKKREMNLVPTSRYWWAAEDLVTMHPFGYRNIGFLSTEDPESVSETMAHNGSFRFLWWDVLRDNSNGPDQLMKLGLRRGELTMIWWLQLFIALEADAWVGTRGSNWNRLIDELRCVWVPKCQNVYVEVGDDASWKSPLYSW